MALRSCLRQFMPVMMLALIGGIGGGCGGGAATEPVSGKLTMDGQPVTGGTITFAPISEGSVAAAEPTSASVNADGTFTANAVAGRNRLVYYAPPVEQGEPQEWDGKGKPPETIRGPFDGKQIQPDEVEIKSGDNDLKLELVSPSAS